MILHFLSEKHKKVTNCSRIVGCAGFTLSHRALVEHAKEYRHGLGRKCTPMRLYKCYFVGVNKIAYVLFNVFYQKSSKKYIAIGEKTKYVLNNSKFAVDFSPD